MSNTREMLVEVARQLFAKTGVENTTMNDIATASSKGRRTLYTYFKNKQEIYRAVVECEIDTVIATFNKLANANLPPEEKLINYIYTRMEIIKEVVTRNGTLKADFFRDIWKVERARRGMDTQEMDILQCILQEGVDKGVFRSINVPATATLLHYAFKGLDVPYIRNTFADFSVDRKQLKNQVIDFILYGIKR